jgi:hypothetical protein
MHRVTWDVHYQPLEGEGRIGGPNLPIAAIPYNTVPAPTTPWANPGQYTVKLSVNGRTYTQPMTVKQDPRVKTPAFALQQIYTRSKAAYYAAIDARDAARQARRLRAEIAKLRPQAGQAVTDRLAAIDAKLEKLEPATADSAQERGAGPAPPGDTLSGAVAALAAVMNLLQGADVQPTTVQLEAIASARAAAAAVMARWTAIKTVDLVAVNARLKAAGLKPIE